MGSTLRWRRALSVTVCAALLAAAAMFVARRQVHRAVDDALRAASGRLGRPVRAGRVDVALLPALDVTLTNLRVEPPAGAQGVARAPLLTVASVHVRVPWWPLARSRGREVLLDVVEVRDPVVTVALLPDGHGSLDGIRRDDHDGDGSARATVRARHVSITRGALRVIDATDASAPETLTARDVTLRADDVGGDRAATLAITAALFGEAPNLRATVRLSPTHRVSTVSLGLTAVDLGPALRMAARHGGGARVTDVAGARLDADLDVDVARETVDVRRADVTLAGMTLSAVARLAREDGHPALRALSVTSRGLTFEGLSPWFAPRGYALRGPLSLTARSDLAAQGSADVRATLDLGDASIEAPGWVHKPAGTPLAAEFRGALRGDTVTVERLGVTLGPLALMARGVVRGARAFDLDVDSGEVPIDPLLRLLPRVRAAVPAGVTMHGWFRVAGDVRADGPSHAARVRVTLRDAAVRTDALSLEGAADASLDATLSPDRWRAEVSVDATRARVTVPSRVDKPVGAPLRAHLRGAGHGAHGALDALSLTMPGAHLAGRAGWDAAARTASVHLSPCEIDVAALSSTMPAAAARAPAPLRTATAHMDLAWEGSLDDHAADHLHVERLELHTATGSLRGSVDLVGLDAPRRVRFDLWGDTLDVAALTAGAEGPRGESPAWLRTVDLEGTLRADVARTPDVTLASPQLAVTLRDGRATLRTLRLGVAGGTVRADGSAVDLADPSHPMDLHVHATRLDVLQVSTAMGVEAARRPTGSLDVDADVSLSGRDAAARRASATGRIHLSGVNLVVRHVESPTVSVVLPLVGARQAPRGGARAPSQPMTVRAFDAPLAIDHGAIHTTSPITVETEAGSVRLSGTVGADDALSLSGEVRVPPSAIAQATHGARITTADVPVSIRVRGRAGAPQVEVVDLGATIRALAGSRLRAIGRGLFQ